METLPVEIIVYIADMLNDSQDQYNFLSVNKRHNRIYCNYYLSRIWYNQNKFYGYNNQFINKVKKVYNAHNENLIPKYCTHLGLALGLRKPLNKLPGTICYIYAPMNNCIVSVPKNMRQFETNIENNWFVVSRKY